MFIRAALVLGLWTLLCSAAQARRITWSCDTVLDRTGEMTRREVIVDTDKRTVSDNTLRWRDGAQRSLFDRLSEFVRVDDDRVSWGDRVTPGDEVLDVFSIHMPSGDYDWSDPKTGRISHGTCWPPTPTS